MPLFCRTVPLFRLPDRASDTFGRAGRIGRWYAACRDRPDGPAFQLDEIYCYLPHRYGRAEILAHEQAHIRACHSLDMWFAGCCAVLHWFNPAVWLLKQELQNVHEYEADESVIAHGVDAKHYQLLLIKKAVGAQRFTSMANSFDHSKLKKRITMMLKQKSNPWARLKFLYVLPLAAVAVAAFARPEISRRLENISEVEFAEVLTSRQDKKMLQTKKDKPLLRPLEFKSNMRPAEGVRYAKPDPLVMIDGVEYTGGLDKVDPNEIESISIMKDKSAIEMYGKKAVGGVILITTKKASSKVK